MRSMLLDFLPKLKAAARVVKDGMQDNFGHDGLFGYWDTEGDLIVACI